MTLTIEPGVKVNLYNYYIIVNGTLRAIGDAVDRIHFNGGSDGPETFALTFEPSSSNYSQQTGTGCIIENAFLNGTLIRVENVSLKINSNVFSSSSIQIYGSSLVISNNNFSNCGVSMMSSIYSPTFASPTIINNTFSNGAISFGGGTASAFATISNNTIYGGGIGGVGYAYIADNNISGCDSGLALNTAVVFGGSEPAYPTVERNLIANNNYGIHINLFSRYEPGTLVPMIMNNTISQNSVAIFITESQYSAAPIILFNNFQNNTNNIYLDQSTPNNVNATYNWWGTVDADAINQTMHDSKNDFSLGTVEFIPFLTAPNPQAMPNTKPTPSQTSTPTSTPSPSIPEFPTSIILPSLIIAATLGAFLSKKRWTLKSTFT